MTHKYYITQTKSEVGLPVQLSCMWITKCGHFSHTPCPWWPYWAAGASPHCLDVGVLPQAWMTINWTLLRELQPMGTWQMDEGMGRGDPTGPCVPGARAWSRPALGRQSASSDATGAGAALGSRPCAFSRVRFVPLWTSKLTHYGWN